MIAFLDVDYRNGGGRAACVLAESWADAAPAATFVADIPAALPYEPGNFYRRELPCLRAVLNLLPETPDVLVVDGYVWLDGDRRPGLGAHLHRVFNGIPVVGIAKTSFRGVDGSCLVERVLRGKSAKPLYVTAAGLDVKAIASAVEHMHGTHRIPSLLRVTDCLARSNVTPLPADLPHLTTSRPSTKHSPQSYPHTAHERTKAAAASNIPTTSSHGAAPGIYPSAPCSGGR